MKRLGVATFVSAPITVIDASFDPAGMARGEPGLPQKFRWRKREFQVAEILEQGKAHGSCTHGSGERYVRRHTYVVRATDGSILRLYFQRSFGRGQAGKSRWWLQSLEESSLSPAVI